MGKSLEREYKTMIHSQDFIRLKEQDKFKLINPIIQHNYYYDTEALNLKSLNAALRLRVFENSSEWTLKISKNQQDSIEITDSVPHVILAPNSIDADTFEEPELLTFLIDNQISLTQFKQTHSFTTHRYIYQEQAYTWCLDATNFPFVTDYELECECHDILSLEAWKEHLSRLGLSYHQAPTKIARASFYAQLFKKIHDQ